MFSVFRRIVQRRAVYLVELLPHSGIVQPKHASATTIQPVEWSNVNRVADARSPEIAHRFRQQLSAGWLGVYAFYQGILVGHFWAQPSGAHRKRMWGAIDFGPHEVILAWGWVSPHHRGQGVFQSMIAELSTLVRAIYPRQRIIADVPIEPLASLNAHRRVGFHRYARLDYVTVARRLVHQRIESYVDGDNDEQSRQSGQV